MYYLDAIRKLPREVCENMFRKLVEVSPRIQIRKEKRFFKCKHLRQCFIRISKYDEQRSIFDEIRGVWIANETLSCLIYLLHRNKKQRGKRRSKIVKTYAVKTRYPPPSRLWFSLFQLDELLGSLRT